MELRQYLIKKSDYWQGIRAALACAKISFDKGFRTVPFTRVQPLQCKAANSSSHTAAEISQQIFHSALSQRVLLSTALGFHSDTCYWCLQLSNCSWVHGHPSSSGCVYSLGLALAAGVRQLLQVEDRWGEGTFIFCLLEGLLLLPSKHFSYLLPFLDLHVVLSKAEFQSSSQLIKGDYI